MCTYNISINDNLLQKALGSFTNADDMRTWIQENVELLLVQHLAERDKQENMVELRPKVHALSEFRGILRSEKPLDMVREEYIGEKFGI